jgi:hypothetical protein
VLKSEDFLGVPKYEYRKPYGAIAGCSAAALNEYSRLDAQPRAALPFIIPTPTLRVSLQLIGSRRKR